MKSQISVWTDSEGNLYVWRMLGSWPTAYLTLSGEDSSFYFGAFDLHPDQEC